MEGVSEQMEPDVRAARGGDPDAFARLVEQHEGRIYRLALRMTLSPDDAAELTQEAFLSAWRALPSFRGRSSFSTWLYRLAYNACIDFLRREKRRRAIFADPIETWAGDIREEPDGRSDPARLLERQSDREAVRAGLAALSEAHRQVLTLRELEGLSYAEIADLIGVSEGTVKSRLNRARLALREILSRQGNFFAADPS